MGQEEVIDYVRLKFSPPDGTTCRRVTTFTNSYKFGDEQEEPVAIKLENTLVYRVSPTKVSITIQPVHGASTRRRMEAYSSFAGGLLTTSDITIFYDRDGRYLSMSGMKRASESLRHMVPEFLRPSIDEILPMELANFQARWEHRFAQFTNLDFPIGKFSRTEQKLPLPNGQTVDIKREFSVIEQGTVDSKNIIHLFNGYTSTDPKLGKAMGDTLLKLLTTVIKGLGEESFLKQLESEFPEFRIHQLWVLNHRYLDSSTMVPKYETDEFSMKVMAQDAEGTLEGAIRKFIEYEYDCT